MRAGLKNEYNEKKFNVHNDGDGMRGKPMAPRFPIETNQFIMDRKLIEEYGEDILSYRLRTARQRKRMQYEDFDKQLLRIHREEEALYKQQQNLGWEPLTPPVQKGWKRFFVLREDVARSKQAEFYENILRKINTCDWSHRRDFMIRKRRFGRKKYVVKGQQLLRPQSWHFERLGFTEAEQQQFHEVDEYDAHGRFITRYVFNEPWRFVLRVRPNMIDKVKKRDSTIESRIQEIDNYLEYNAHRYRQLKLLTGEGRYKFWKSTYDEKEKEVYAFKNKSLSQIMDIIRAT